MQWKKMNAFIWDFDGTLFDTYPHTMDAMQAAAADLGLTVDRGELYGWLMQNIPYAIDCICAAGGFRREEFLRLYWEYVGEDLSTHGGPFFCAQEVLSQVKRQGGRNFMFTHRENDVYPFLDRYGMRDLFTRILTLADGVERKPSPDGILRLIREYRLDPACTVMVGDRELDVLSGKNAGIRTCHVTNRLPYTPFEADARVDGLDELLCELNRADSGQ